MQPKSPTILESQPTLAPESQPTLAPLIVAVFDTEKAEEHDEEITAEEVAKADTIKLARIIVADSDTEKAEEHDEEITAEEVAKEHKE